MKKNGFGKRALSLLLALTIVLSLTPISSIQAATAGDTYVGSAKLGSNIDTQDTISWPIKVYDFLNDGMLFEYTDHGALASTYVQGTSSSGTYDYLQVATLPSGSGYTNGNSNPFVQGTTLGNDYTVTQGYYNGSTGTYAMRTWGTQTSFSYNFDDNALEVSRSVVAAGSGAPMYLRYSYSGSGTTKSYGWISNFARDDGQYYSTSQVRYLVLVYRTGSSYTEGTVQPYWAVSRSGSYNTDYTWWTGTRGWAGIDISDLCYDSYLTTADDNLPLFGWMAEGVRHTGILSAPQVPVPASTSWTYLVVDMMHEVDGVNYLTYAYPGTSGTNDILIASNTANINGNCIAGVGLGLPLDANGETLDVAQIAYFGTEAAANDFGAKAVSYAKNPGTYSGATISLTETDSHKAPVVNNSLYSSDFMDYSATPTPKMYTFGYYTTSSNSTSSSYYSYPTLGTVTWNYAYYNGNQVGIRQVGINSTGSSSLVRTFLTYNTYNSTRYDSKWMTNDPDYAGSYNYVRYITMVYQTIGIDDLKMNLFVSNFNDGSTTYEYIAGYDGTKYTTSAQAYVVDVPENAYGYESWYKKFQTAVLDLNDLAEYITGTEGATLSDVKDYYYGTYNTYRFDSVGVRFIGMDTTNPGYRDSVFFGYVDFFTEETAAQAYGIRRANYADNYDESVLNSRTTTVTYTSNSGTRLYQTGNNLSYGMFWASGRGTWATNMYGGANTSTNGYYSYVIGDTWLSAIDSYRSTAKSTYGYVVSDSIYQINPYYYNNSTSSTTYIMDTSAIGVDPGYTLYNTVTGTASSYTMGLLEHGLLSETGMDGYTYKVLDYKGDTIAYIAQLLRNTLVIPEYYYQTNTAGGVTYDKLYMYNYISGTASAQYSADGSAITLADALRDDMGIVFTSSNYNGSSKATRLATPSASLGTYAQTFAYIEEYKEENNGVNPLIGPYLDCKEHINTFCDAAYYLLMNLFVDNSYNQRQHTYSYLVLSKALLSDGDTEAYVFDAGFTDEAGNSGVVYDVANKSIGLSTAAAKEYLYATSTLVTTANPFLPVYDGADTAGDPYKATGTVYYFDEGALAAAGAYNSYVNRNYNYTLQANGQFVYHYDDDLYFDFEGDDDVYLFINGELVLDIGGAHSIAAVSFRMNDYVDAAVAAIDESYMVGELGYEFSQGEEVFLEYLDEAIGEGEIDEGERDTYIRYYKLALQEGESYDIDFYYMERHGYGANMRIATNIVMSDPSLVTEKSAYQGTDENGDLIEVPYGGLIDDSQPLHYSFSTTNNGNLKLYNLSFMDAPIGVNLTYDKGLQVYGKPTVTQFTATSGTTLRIEGLDGAFTLDGTSYYVDSSGWITTEGSVSVGSFLSIPASSVGHTLTLYQCDPDVLFTDMTVSVILGEATTDDPLTPTLNSTLGAYVLTDGNTYQLTVAGVCVTDADGGMLEVSDLTIKVDGYASEQDYIDGIPTDTLEIYLDSNEELMAFLHNLEDPGGQTGSEETEGEDAQFSGDGMWPYATITIEGIRYILSAEEQEGSMFENTVYTYAYRDRVISQNSEQLKSQDKHKVYFIGGEPVYYQWAGHTVHLKLEQIWYDTTQLCLDETNVLSQNKELIESFDGNISSDHTANDGVVELTVELCDMNGDPLPEEPTGYAWNETNRALEINFTTTGVHVFYLKLTHSDIVGSIVVPITIYTTDVQDKVFVLDYGLTTEDLNAEGQLFEGDEMLGALGSMTAKLTGVYTVEPGYKGDFRSHGQFYGDWGMNFVDTYAYSDPFISADDDDYQYADMGQGSFYMSEDIPDEGIDLTFDGSKYVLDSDFWFTPEEFLTEAYVLYLTMTVHEKTATFSDWVDTENTYHNGHTQWCVDVGNEVMMYKKLTVLPANVVYYEDDFAGITYSGTEGNFEYHGDGSGSLTQQVESDGVYGQDPVYQKSSNSSMSGEHLTKYKITDTDLVASFTFTGTGFEIIGQTNAVDSGTMIVEVFPEGETESSHYFPVITEFDNGNNGGAEAIYQVPVVRLDGLDYGTYTVNISGNPAYDFSEWDGTMANLASQVKIQDSYLYIDGIRIYQPMTDSNENYINGENGAQFDRIRDQILNGAVGVATLTGDGLNVSNGTVTWTEDRSGDSEGDTSYTANQVASADDYLIQGPNNEVYMEGSVSNSAIVMYAKPTEILSMDPVTASTASRIPSTIAADRTVIVAGSGASYSASGIEVVSTFSAALSYLTTNSATADGLIIVSGTATESSSVNTGYDHTGTIYVTGTYSAYGVSGGVISFSRTGNSSNDFCGPTVFENIGLEIANSTSLFRLHANTSLIFGDGVTVTDSGERLRILGGSFNSEVDGSYIELNSGKFDGVFPVNNQYATGTCQIVVGGTATVRALCAGGWDADNNKSVGAVSITVSGGTVSKLQPAPAVSGLTTGSVVVNLIAGAAVTMKQGNGTVTNGATLTLSGFQGELDSGIDFTLFNTVTLKDGAVDYTGTSLSGQKITASSGARLYFPNISAQPSGVTVSRNVYFGQSFDTPYIQIAVRALDYSLFYGTGMSEPNVVLQCGIVSDDEYSWLEIATIRSSTEQYYQIPLSLCPVVDGCYQIVLRAINKETGVSAMVSYSSIKSVGLELVEDKFADFAATKEYVDGVLVDTSGSGAVEASAWNFMTLRNQMSASTAYTSEKVEIPSDSTVYPSQEPDLAMKYASLSFEDEIRYNLYFTATNLDDVKELGLLVFNSYPIKATVDYADQVISNYRTDGTNFMVQTDGVAAKNMGDALYFTAYAKLADGNYTYSQTVNYSAVRYANSILTKSEDDHMKALVVAMLNYGAEAQKYFGYNTDNLMNAGLDEAAQALVPAYSDDTMSDPQPLVDSKNKIFKNVGFGTCYITASFDSAFALNYYFTTSYVPDNGVKLFYWTEEAYAAADVLNGTTATGMVKMTATGGTNQFWANIDGIAAKEMGETIYVGGMYTSDGVTYSTGIMNYSLGRYCDTIANKEGSLQQELSKATAVYGACAKDYFDNLYS